MSKEPQLVLRSIYAFPPNRFTLGGTAYLIVKNQGNILIDCPIWDAATAEFVHRLGGVSQLILTHRGGLSEQLPKIASALNCTVVVQEQEAYLVSHSIQKTTFHHELTWEDGDRVFWTPGHSPGTCCYYHAEHNLLFTGRHLVPNKAGEPSPLKTPKTFHWKRQLQNVERLTTEFNQDSLTYIMPGANLGRLRGNKFIDQAYEKLSGLKMDSL